MSEQTLRPEIVDVQKTTLNFLTDLLNDNTPLPPPDKLAVVIMTVLSAVRENFGENEYRDTLQKLAKLGPDLVNQEEPE